MEEWGSTPAGPDLVDDRPTSAKKSTAKKSTAKKSTAKKSTAKKSTVEKSTVEKSAAKKPKDEIGSRRGVESLFRNSYRAHLDLLALAATKANIMISINGLILSFLFISGAFVVSGDPMLEIPVTIFLVTCFISIAFAILSALPESGKNNWTEMDFLEQRANPLVFEDYTALSEGQFVSIMRETLQDSPQIYDSMTRQLYFLGSYANKRLKLLSLSYRVFLAGLCVSVLSFFMVFLITSLRDLSMSANASPPAGVEAESLARFGAFRDLEGVFEPSGVVQLPDGRLVVVEDESARPISIVSLDTTGDMRVAPPGREPLFGERADLRGLGSLSDLEGTAIDKSGRVYAVTSHARKEKTGRTSASREKLVRFRIDGTRVTDATLVSDLKAHMTARYPDLEEAATKRAGGFNIEGLAFDREQKELWFGFRSPLMDGKAIILALENPSKVFDGEEPRFKRISLDLDGAGIRGLAYFPRLSGYLLLARREDRKKMPFELWFWSGHQGDAARSVEVAGVDSLRRAEAIAPMEFGDTGAILILSDEGNAGKDAPGRYVLLQYDRLSIAGSS